jgi:hypothetical protein
MAGKIKAAIDAIVTQRANGNPTIASTTKTKILLKGINPDAFSAVSEDDPEVLERVRKIAAEFNVRINI